MPAAVVGAAEPVALRVVDVPDAQAARAEASAELSTGFDLSVGPLLRATLLRLDPHDHVLVLAVHHVATDGWSQALLWAEVTAAYGALAAGREPRLPELPVQYGDFASWQRSWLSGEVLESRTAYWTERLAGLGPLELPLDKARPAVASGRAGSLPWTVPAELVSSARAVAEEEGATLYMALLAAFTVVLSRYADTEDVAVGSPTAGRTLPEVEPLIGFFVNTVVVRTDTSGDPSFRELLGRVRESTVGAVDHQDVPFEHLVERLSPERDLSRNPLVQVAFQLLTGVPEWPSWPGSEAGPFETDVERTRMDLEVHAVETDGEVTASVLYAADLFDADTIRQLMHHVTVALRQLLADPDRPLSTADMLDEDDRHRTLVEWNDTAAPLPEGSVPRLFTDQAARTPDHVALICGEERVTYAELDRRANRVAQVLLAHGVRPDEPVGVATGRSVGMVAAVLGVLKAGGAYVPLDPRNPAERTERIVATSGMRVALADRPVPHSDALTVLDADDPGDAPESDPGIDPHPETTAYVIYTSGSSGEPKGVAVTHRNVVVLAADRRWQNGNHERLLLHYPLATDISAYELWPCLLAGRGIVIAADEHVEPETFERLISEHGVTAMCLPAPLFDLLAEECLPCFGGLREVLTGGEAVSGETVARVMAAHPHLTVVDAYGPTEATAFATLFPMEPGFTLSGSRVPIGAPIDNTRVYVVDRELRPVPLGVAGELVIAGPRVARGYLGMPELTAEKFQPDPWGPPGARMYRTGDVVRWLPSGALEFLGRDDAQVKIRGFRIEPGEVEAVLLRHSAVSQVTVTVREDQPGERRLVAYVVLEPDSDGAGEAELSGLSALRAHAAAGMPDYMVPSAFVALDAFPLSTTGKIDRKALPAPDPRALAEAGYTPPATDAERAMCEIFAEVLAAQSVGADDDFFALGGHSLLATRAMARIRARFEPNVPLQKLFELRTPRRLAAAVGTPEAAEDTIEQVSRDGALPLSFSQRRLWFLDRLTPQSGFWNVAMGVRARGPLDVEALGRALSTVVARHEALRTVFREEGGTPVAYVSPAEELQLTVTDVADEEEARTLAAEDAARSFDLAQGPLLRAGVLRIGPEDHALLVTVHHAATDGWSHAVFWGELAEAYAAARAQRPPELPELPIQYGDFAVWQREHLTGAVLERHLDYWRDRLAGLRPLELPLDRPRPAVATSDGASQPWELPEDVVRAARALGDDEGATLYMTLLAAFTVVLGRFADTEDVAVGTPVAGRTRPEVDRLIGFFVNMLVLRTDLTGDPSFRELLARVREGAVGAMDHQDLPFEHLVETLAPERDLSRNPLVQVVFQLMREPADRGEGLGEARLEPLLEEHAFTRVDLEVHLTEDGDRVRGTVLHSTALFEAATVRRLLHHMTVLLRGALADPDAPLSQLSVLDDGDREQLLERWNDTAVPYRDASLAELFAEQAARTPDAVAVECGTDSLTYAELDRAAERIADALRASGVRPDDLVGLCLDRSTALIAGLVGILKAGAAYVPIDPTHPRDRVRLIVRDAGMAVAVTERAHAEVFDDATALIQLDGPSGAVPDDAPAERLSDRTVGSRRPGPDSLAYVVYTSGSTGAPKGIGMPARCVVNMLAWQKKAVPGGPGTRTAHFTALTFDVSVQEVLSALLYGETLVVPEDEVRRDPARFARWIDERAVEQVFVPNLMIRALAEEANEGRARLTSLRHISQAGEPLSLDGTLREFCAARPELRLHNHYGSTEIQVVTALTLSGDVTDWPATAHLGWPVDNSRAYVLDSQLRPAPVGVAGELCFAGPGLARGYLNRPDLTATKFVPNPFGPPGSRLYRTGDLGRWRPDGSLEFLGRLDHQVKIRGFRVELGEVEAVLLRHPEVARAVVVAREDTPGTKRLVGYVVPAPGAEPELPARLRVHLAGAVPDYMVPSAFVALDAFPLTTTGKVDHGALPEPQLRTTLRVGYTAARTREEEALCQIFGEVLEAELDSAGVGIDDDFFALGGHSLVATRTVARVREVLGVELSLRELFQHRTPRALAEVVAAAPGAAAPALVPVPRDRPLPLSLTQTQLWKLHTADPDDPVWTVPLALRLRGGLDVPLLGRALTEVLRRHEVLRTVFLPRAEADDGEGPASVVLPVEDVELEPIDVAHEGAARAAAGAEAARPFDLTHGPVLRPALLRIAPDDHVLLLTVHHIATDGWSQGVLWSELSELYAALCEEREPELRELPVQYGDFAVWQRSWLTGEVLDEELAHWRGQLAGLRPLPLPETATGSRTTLEGANVPAERQPDVGVLTEWRLPPELVAAARAAGAAHDATLYMTLLAAFTATLARSAGVEDLAVGSPVAGRSRSEVRGLIGFFANFVPLRTDLSGDPSFAELLGRVRATAVDAYAHQVLPWERIAEGLGLDPAEPLVDVVFQLVNVELGELRLPGVRVEPFSGERVYARWNLEVHLVEDVDGGLTGHVVHRPTALDQSSVDALLDGTVTLLTAALEEVDRPVSALAATPVAAPESLGMTTPHEAAAPDRPLEALPYQETPAPSTDAGSKATPESNGTHRPEPVDDPSLASPSASAEPSAAPGPGRGDAAETPAEADDPAPVLTHRLGGLPEPERHRLVLDLVLGQVAEVLELGIAEDVPPDRAIRELGLRSLTAVQLLLRLSRITGVKLPTTAIYDHPTPRALAGALVDAASGGHDPAAVEEEPARRADDGDPVVVVGMACRFPGGVTTPEGLWRVLAEERDTITPFPSDRGWDLDALADQDGPMASRTRHGGFLDDAALFDAGFFGISPREAQLMDPQQRLLLETSWEALERAGVAPGSWRGGRVGVFTGANAQSYSALLAGVPEGGEGHALTGRLASVVSGRIAYVLGLEGPAFTVDTACSSSLAAIHLAVRSVRSGESTMALAGGVTVMPTPEMFTDFTKQGGISADGRCRSYARAADGLGWSEGAGMLLLERLSDARRNGHPVLAALPGSATNQDGASNGLTAPSGASQQRVVRQALADAGLGPSEVDAVEGHGTGTSLGDPIEAQALLASYGQSRADGQPLWLGSVKSNLGHTQSAAGVAGVMKMVLALRHELLPKTLHVDEPSPHVDWVSGAVRLLTEARPWPRGERPRRAGVSSFGVSGTNAHVIVEEVPDPPDGSSTAGDHARRAEELSEGGRPGSLAPIPWLLSARSETALREQAARLRTFAADDPTLAPADVGLTLATRRTAFDHRAAVVGGDREELLAGLDVLAAGGTDPSVVRGVAGADGRTVFVFAGQGGQWRGMGVELLDHEPVFARRMAECERALAPYLDWSVTDALRGTEDAPPLTRVDVVQPVLFSLMVSLAALWRSRGVVPSAVAGHSQGEIAAAAVAGALTLEDAARIVALRARAVVDLPGRMGSVSAPVADVEKMLERWPGRLSIAAVNSPRSVVVAGDREALEEWLDLCDDEGLRAGRVAADYASHSPGVESARERLLAELRDVRPREGEVPIYSTVTADWIDGTELDARYWYRNLREPVRFHDAVRGLLAAGHHGFVEVSPHPVLTVAMEQTAEDEGVELNATATLRRDESDLRRFTTSLAEVAAGGVPVDWRPVFEPTGAHPVELPGYPFQRERYWLAPGAAGAGDLASVGLAPGQHPLVGAETELPDDGGLVLSGRLAPDDHPWLTDHTVLGTALVPGTAVLELVAHAGSRVGRAVVEELTLTAPLPVPGDGLTLRVTVRGPDETGRRGVRVHSATDDGWTAHATGTLAPAEAPTASGPCLPDGPDVHASEGATEQWPPAGAHPVPLDGVYERLAARGFGYGPSFRGLRALWRGDRETLAEIALDDTVDTSGFAAHPALLDAAAQAVLADGREDAPVLLPFSWSGVTLRPTASRRLRVRATRTPEENGETVRLTVSDDQGVPVLTLQELRLRPASPDQLRAAAATSTRDALFHAEWLPVPTAVAASCAVWGEDTAGLDGLAHATLDAVTTVPELVLAPVTTGDDPVAETHRATAETLERLRCWLADERFAAARLAVVTRGAVTVRPGDPDERVDPAAAAVWGLVRSAQTEHPGRFQLIDTDGTPESLRAVPEVGDEPRVALRGGQLFAARLAGARSASGDLGAEGDDTLRPPADTPHWRVNAVRRGTLDGLEAVRAPDTAAPLAPGEVRIAVRAAGVNFRDVLCALGMYPDQVDAIGSEAAGTVLEVGSEITDLSVGDRVLGMVPGGLGPRAVVDRRLVHPVPEGWTWVEAAALPSAFTTARYALTDLAEVRPGDRVLVHAAAGGVGQAAVQLAQSLGAEVFGTASPAKHGALRAAGLDDEHLASSRSTEFAERFPAMDVVLNSLAGEFTDASLELLAAGGRFVELGKTDRRDPGSGHIRSDVAYRPFDLLEVGPERIQGLLAEVVSLAEAGEVAGLPTRTWPLTDAKGALRFMAQARHIGKIVLTVAPFADGTVLLTGAGVLGGRLARHLVAEHGARHLVLASRRGARAPGSEELVEELARLGATARFVECDLTDRAAVDALLSDVPVEHPLTAVVHTAGALDDGVLTSLTGDRLSTVLSPKADAAWHLHEASRERGLAAFVLFSSVAATVGTPAQANYAAANAFLDALAERRRAEGLPATSLAWGLWAEATGLTGHLKDGDVAWAGRGGIVPMSEAEGLALFDAAVLSGDPLTVTARLNTAALPAGVTFLPPRGRAGEPATPASSRKTDAAALVARIAALPATERASALLGLVRGHAAEVLGHAAPDAVDAARGFKELGFDSLTAVELRNRLGAATGLRLATTLIFDHPTPAALAEHLLSELLPEKPEGADDGAVGERIISELASVEGALAELPAGSDERSRAVARLREMVARWTASDTDEPGLNHPDGGASELENATADELFDLIDRGIS